MWSSLVVRMPDQAREPLHISRKSRFTVIRADRLGGRGIEFVGGRANACLHRSAHHLILDPDRFEALLGDAKRHGSGLSIASPGQQRAMGADLFQQPRRMSLSTAFRTASSVT